MRSMQQQYGSKKRAERVFYASINKGTIKGVEESVFNTYRTLAYLLSEVKSTVEHEKAIRDKETKDEKDYQDWRASEGKPRTPMQDEDNPNTKMMRALGPENFPPYRVDKHSPEQYGQRAGTKAGDRRHKRLKKIASQPLRVKVSRALKKGARKVERRVGKAVNKVMKGVKRDEKNQPVGINVEPRTARQWKELQSRKEDFAESVFNTYRTMAYLLTEIGDTKKGKAFIRAAMNKRKAQYDAAIEGGPEAYHDRPPSEKDVHRVARGVEQMHRVAQYMNKRLEHEDAAEHSPDHVEGYLQHRRKLAKHPKASKRDKNWTEPKTKEELQQDMGDYGARRGTQEYKEGIGKEAPATRKRLKDLGTTTTASVGMKKVLHNIKLKKQADNFRSN